MAAIHNQCNSCDFSSFFNIFGQCGFTGMQTGCHLLPGLFAQLFGRGDSNPFFRYIYLQHILGLADNAQIRLGLAQFQKFISERNVVGINAGSGFGFVEINNGLSLIKR